MLVCIIKRSKQEAIYLLKIVFTQSSELILYANYTTSFMTQSFH